MGRDVRIMHVVKGLRYAGLERVVVDLILNLKGFQQMVCVEERYNGPPVCNHERDLNEANIKIFRMNRPENRAQRDLPLRYRKLFKDQSIWIVHTHSGVWRDALIGGKLAGVPLHFHTEHGIQNDFLRVRERLTYRILSELSSQLISVSEDLRTRLVSKIKVSPKKVMVVHNGIDLEKYKPLLPRLEIRRELRIGHDEQVIGTVGRIVPLKDHKTLVRAYAILHQRCPHTRLVIVGREDTSLVGIKDNVVRLARELGVLDRIIFTGERHDIPDLLNLFDVFVLSSWTEGISISLLEAAAMSKPVVATRVGGNPEIVKDKISGFLVPVRDPEALAEKLLMVLENKHMAQNMGIAGREVVRREFTVETMIDQYQSLYKTSLAYSFTN